VIHTEGHSAGGHIAAWLASKPARRELDKFGEPVPLLGAVSVSGALDLKLSEMRVTGSFGIFIV
jgi:acetyl esterase/lipase